LAREPLDAGRDGRAFGFAASRRPQRAEAADSQRRRCVAAQIRPLVDAPLLGLECGSAASRA
jgi:hypothetical protein